MCLPPKANLILKDNIKPKIKKRVSFDMTPQAPYKEKTILETNLFIFQDYIFTINKLGSELTKVKMELSETIKREQLLNNHILVLHKLNYDLNVNLSEEFKEIYKKNLL
jgi:hypothetical protein